jgi:SPOR domain/PilZ domain
MLSSRESSGKQSSIEERRAYPREQIPFARNLFYIDLGNGKPATVLNISEGGLAIQAIADSIDGRLPRIRLRYSKSRTCIESGGRISWANASKDVAGIEFTSLTNEGRNQIREWLAEVQTPQAGVSAGEASHPLQALDSVFYFVRPPEPKLSSENKFQRTVPKAFAKPAVAPLRKNVVSGKNQSRNLRGPRSLAGLLAILSTAGLVLLLLALQIHGMRSGEAAAHHEPSAEPTQFPTGILFHPEQSTPVEAFSAPSGPSKRAAGYVLQAGAMLHEENANQFADLLRQKDFPAYVFKSDSDRFYRIYVGPYPDRQSAVNTSGQLVKQGFAAIVRRWSPTQ